jgi:dTMP kinase
VSRRAAGRGRFLVVEGLDGAGTTTQARRLAAALREAGRRVHVTAEPSGGPVGALARLVLSKRLGGAPGQAAGGGDAGFDPGALALLFAADRLDHLRAEIEPRLAAGEDVVSDRFTLSSLAYQSLTCGSLAWVEAVNSRARAPDLTLFLKVPARVAVARRQAENGGGELFEVPEFQRRVARAYDRSVARLRARGERVEVVDGTRPVEEVTAALAAAVRRLR